MSSNNPYRPQDRVQIERGGKWLTGTVTKTNLARCHVLIDGRVFVEDWHNMRRRGELPGINEEAAELPEEVTV